MLRRTGKVTEKRRGKGKADEGLRDDRIGKAGE